MARKGSSKAFTKSVTAWIEQTERDSTDIARDAARAFVSEYQANTPKVSGNLANSTHVAASPHDLIKGEPSQKYADPTAANNAVIDSMELGDHVYVAQVAPYAASIEFGKTTLDGNQPGHFHGSQTAAKWAGMVRRVAKAKNRRTK